MARSRTLFLCCLITVLGVTASGSGQNQTATGAGGEQASRDVSGTWSGTFESQHPDRSPFTITIVIAPSASGKLQGTTNLTADCFKNGVLQVIVTGLNVVFAGSDPEGNNVTFKGTLNSSGTLLNMTYIVNGSASGRCESDRGSGNLGKR